MNDGSASSDATTDYGTLEAADLGSDTESHGGADSGFNEIGAIMSFALNLSFIVDGYARSIGVDEGSVDRILLPIGKCDDLWHQVERGNTLDAPRRFGTDDVTFQPRTDWDDGLAVEHDSFHHSAAERIA